MKQSDRYRIMKKAGYSDDDILKAFHQKQEMTVFSYQGDIDTLMTPMDSIRYYKHFLRVGFMSMDPHTGYVKAYVGGPNYTHFQYDMAMVGRRQIGSTIKPFLYTLAMENGFSPCDETRNVEQTLVTETGETWTPRNSSRKRYGEMVTLKWGLANSNNWISAYLMSKLNPYALVRLIHNFGVLNKDIQPTPSLCLGPCEISVGEMVSAYTAFANKGIRTAPVFVNRIEDSDGNVLAEFSPVMQEVISESSAYKMLIMLRAVINEGTGGRVRFRYGITADMGGKTGTTNGSRDGWFCGMTPYYTMTVWVGYDQQKTLSSLYGGTYPAKIWKNAMEKMVEGLPAASFDTPETDNGRGEGTYLAGHPDAFEITTSGYNAANFRRDHLLSDEVAKLLESAKSGDSGRSSKELKEDASAKIEQIKSESIKERIQRIYKTGTAGKRYSAPAVVPETTAETVEEPAESSTTIVPAGPGSDIGPGHGPAQEPAVGPAAEIGQ